MKMNKVFFLMMATVFLGTLAKAHAEELSKGIFVSDAWVQAIPPSQESTAAYMVMTNNTKKEAVLVSAESDIATSTEIHQMSDKNGIMHMAMVSVVPIPAHGKVSLQPGGFHLMLIKLKKIVKRGDQVLLTLHFQDASTVTVNAKVKLGREEIQPAMPGMKM